MPPPQRESPWQVFHRQLSRDLIAYRRKENARHLKNLNARVKAARVKAVRAYLSEILRETAGSITTLAALLGLTYRPAMRLVTLYDLAGLARELRATKELRTAQAERESA